MELFHPGDKLQMWNFEQLDAAWKKRGEQGRPEGIHLTDILYGQMYRDHFGKPPGFADPSQEDRESPGIRMQMGYMWERVFDWAWKELGRHQDEIETQLHGTEKDGILMTPDGLIYRQSRKEDLIAVQEPLFGEMVMAEREVVSRTPYALAEFKATWRSLRSWEKDPEEEFITWFWQTKAYAYALGVTRINFFIFFVNGDYRYAKGRGPIAISQEFEYSEEELKRNWDKILAYKEIESVRSSE